MRRSNFICEVTGCEKQASCRQLCKAHYVRWKRHGNPICGRTSPGEKEAFLIANVSYAGEGCLLSPYQDDKNRNYWFLNIEGEQISAHRWMCEKANGPAPSATHMAAHNCGAGHLGCVHPKHLRWATASENAQDKYQHGTAQYGERCNTAKLKESDIPKIRGMIGKTPSAKIARLFGVSKKTILLIGHRRTWSHVE